MGLLPVAFGALPASADPKKMLIEKGGALIVMMIALAGCVLSVACQKKAKANTTQTTAVKRGCLSLADKAERNVVQIVAGYRYKPQSDVTVTIDGKKFTLFTIEDRAYASSEEDDLRMIAAMKRGSNMTIVGISAVAPNHRQIFLAGFTKLNLLLIRPAIEPARPKYVGDASAKSGQYIGLSRAALEAEVTALVAKFRANSFGAGYGAMG